MLKSWGWSFHKGSFPHPNNWEILRKNLHVTQQTAIWLSSNSIIPINSICIYFTYLVHFCLNSMCREYWIFGDSVLILKTQAEGLECPGQKLLFLLSRLGGSLKVDLTSWKFEMIEESSSKRDSPVRQDLGQWHLKMFSQLPVFQIQDIFHQIYTSTT